ncbi:MAG: response regulator, partial [Frankia sp.]|nr:response regulator [Frankia sp.]
MAAVADEGGPPPDGAAATLPPPAGQLSPRPVDVASSTVVREDPPAAGGLPPPASGQVAPAAAAWMGQRPARADAGAVLLIADADVDQALVRAFADRGVGVRVVADGALALLEAGRLAPSALLVSARLPVVDGVDVVRAVRAMRGREELTILLAVGPQERPLAAAGLDAGASACVAKPYLVSEVLALIGWGGGAVGTSSGQPAPATLVRQVATGAATAVGGGAAGSAGGGLVGAVADDGAEVLRV